MLSVRFNHLFLLLLGLSFSCSAMEFKDQKEKRSYKAGEERELEGTWAMVNVENKVSDKFYLRNLKNGDLCVVYKTDIECDIKKPELVDKEVECDFLGEQKEQDKKNEDMKNEKDAILKELDRAPKLEEELDLIGLGVDRDSMPGSVVSVKIVDKVANRCQELFERVFTGDKVAEKKKKDILAFFKGKIEKEGVNWIEGMFDRLEKEKEVKKKGLLSDVVAAVGDTLSEGSKIKDEILSTLTAEQRQALIKKVTSWILFGAKVVGVVGGGALVVNAGLGNPLKVSDVVNFILGAANSTIS